MTWTPPSSSCVRAAWLTLGALSVQLENQPGGWFCSSLDLGYPDVRDVVTNKPDQDGVDDRTRYMGARTVTANITALRWAGARIDQVAASFAPFMAPSARPVLHYVLDRPGAAERTLTLRGSGYSWPVAGADQRDIQLQWVAADPVVRDPNTRTAIAWSGSSTLPGRAYALGFNRIYPAGGSSPNSAIIASPGDLPVRPLLRVYGPITAAQVNFQTTNPGSPTGTSRVWFVAGYAIGAGHWVDVDCARKTAVADSNNATNVITSIDWVNTIWPVLPPNPGSTTMTVAGGSTSGITQVQAIWNDGYIS